MNTVFTIIRMIEVIDPTGHPPISQDMAETFIILLYQSGKLPVFLFLFGNGTMDPFIVCCVGNFQLLTHPVNTPMFFFIKISDCHIFRFIPLFSKPHILSNSFTFFNSSTTISFSSSWRFRRRFSLRSFSNSSASSSVLWCPLLSVKPSSPFVSYFFTQE